MLAGVGAYAIWGLFPLYWPLLVPAGAMEILAHRIVWSAVLVIGGLAVARHWGWLRTMGAARARWLALAAVVVGLNWGVYIWAVNSAHVVEASLGYFINPLVTVCLGVLFLGERLRPMQWSALGVGAVAVAVLTVNYGKPPLIALVLAASFATYGLAKKKAGMPAVEGLSVETGLLFLPATAYLVWLGSTGRGTFAAFGLTHSLLLAGSGLVTAVPLLLFGYSAVRIPLSTLGLLQYLTPMLQFIIGVFLDHEPMPAVRWLGFGLVWVALAVLSADGLLGAGRRRSRRRALMEVAVDAAESSPV